MLYLLTWKGTSSIWLLGLHGVYSSFFNATDLFSLVIKRHIDVRHVIVNRRNY
uniref:Uncharacterized protein n=1 Tax=Rhizophora mucronata TaxID=61149 RepID=A0A2P2NDB6_RHIMU